MTTKTSIRRAAARRSKVKDLAVRLRAVEVDLRIIAERIDAIGEEASAMGLGHGHRFDPDQLGCYASNSLQGTLALLRELGVVLAGPMRRRR